MAWQPITDDIKNGEPVLLKYRDDIEGERYEAWRGVVFVGRHEGNTPSGYDLGWSFAAPVGYGGIPDIWLEGWQPIPSQQ